jgi:hypothetical protein
METTLLEIAKIYGPWAALACFLLWRTVVIDGRMAAALDRAEKRQADTAAALLRVLADNTRALDRASRALESVRVYLPQEQRQPPTDADSDSHHPAPARHFTTNPTGAAS